MIRRSMKKSAGEASNLMRRPAPQGKRDATTYARVGWDDNNIETSLDHVRELLNEWQDDYNTVRPHSGIGNLPPSTYARLTASDMHRDGTLRCFEGSAVRPVASLSHTGSNGQRVLPIAE